MPTRIATFFLILCFAAPVLLSAQASDCNITYASPQTNAMAQQEWESQKNPVYVDATNLSHDLAARGITVECIRSSKEEQLFRGQKVKLGSRRTKAYSKFGLCSIRERPPQP